MKRLTREQPETVVQQWKRAAPALARAREEELVAWQYDAETVDALLAIGARLPRREEPSGSLEMQRWFIKIAQRQGLLPVVREDAAAYAPVRSDEARPACARASAGRRLAYYKNAALSRQAENSPFSAPSSVPAS
jgi:hypothetical protein